MKKKFLNLSYKVFLAILLIVPGVINAQSVTQTLNCGAEIEAELTGSELEHDYMLLVPAGTILNGRVEPIGSTFNSYLMFFDSSGNKVAAFNDGIEGQSDSFSDFIIGSTNPTLRIVGIQLGYSGIAGAVVTGRYTGAYALYLGCTLRDGTVIEPGETFPSSPVSPAPAFSGVGFPGLAPVDFAGATKLPLIANTPMTAAITPAGGEILGFTLDANAGDIFDMTVTRISGNLNLGVVVLSSDNKVVFYGGLITSESLSTRLTLPSAGQYTIGIFRVDLLPPDAPQATAFQVTGTLNP